MYLAVPGQGLPQLSTTDVTHALLLPLYKLLACQVQNTSFVFKKFKNKFSFNTKSEPTFFILYYVHDEIHNSLLS